MSITIRSIDTYTNKELQVKRYYLLTWDTNGVITHSLNIISSQTKEEVYSKFKDDVSNYTEFTVVEIPEDESKDLELWIEDNKEL